MPATGTADTCARVRTGCRPTRPRPSRTAPTSTSQPEGAPSAPKASLATSCTRGAANSAERTATSPRCSPRTTDPPATPTRSSPTNRTAGMPTTITRANKITSSPEDSRSAKNSGVLEITTNAGCAMATPTSTPSSSPRRNVPSKRAQRAGRRPLTGRPASSRLRARPVKTADIAREVTRRLSRDGSTPARDETGPNSPPPGAAGVKLGTLLQLVHSDSELSSRADARWSRQGEARRALRERSRVVRSGRLAGASPDARSSREAQIWVRRWRRGYRAGARASAPAGLDKAAGREPLERMTAYRAG